MRRLDAIIAVLGVAVLLVGIGGSFAFGVEEGLESDEVQTEEHPTDLVSETVDVASKQTSFTQAPGATSVTVEIPVEVRLESLSDLAFEITVERAPVLAGNSEWTMHVLTPAGDRIDSDSRFILGPAGTSVSDSIPVNFTEANVTEPVGEWTAVIEGAFTGQSTGEWTGRVDVTGTALVPEADADAE